MVARPRAPFELSSRSLSGDVALEIEADGHRAIVLHGLAAPDALIVLAQLAHIVGPHAEGDPVWREDRDFVEAVQGHESRIRAPYAEALMTHRVALAAAQSARTGSIVRMEGLRLDPQPPFRRAAAARPNLPA